MKRSILSLVLGSLFFVSCGYKLSDGDLVRSHPKIAVSYVKGDKDGRVTTSLIKAINDSTSWTYTNSHSDILLEVEIIKNDFYNIDYQYDRVESTAELINRLVPTGGRRVVLAKVVLLNPSDHAVLYGPFEIDASAEYDFVNFDTYKDLSFVDQAGTPHSVLKFSLGQLDAQEDATDAVLTSVYQKLSQKIVLGLQNL